MELKLQVLKPLARLSLVLTFPGSNPVMKSGGDAMKSPFRSSALVIKVMTAHTTVNVSTVSAKIAQEMKDVRATLPMDVLRGLPVTLLMYACPVMGERGVSVMQSSCAMRDSIALMVASANLVEPKD